MLPLLPSLRTSSSLVALFALALTTPSLAQVSSGGQPEGLLQALIEPIPAVVVAPPDVAAYLADDLARGHKPLRYGALVDLHLTLEDGAWADLPDGSRAWRVRILSPGAKSMSVEFELLELPRGARMYVYSQVHESVLGAYTADNHHEDQTFVFEPYPGEDLILEIDLPAQSPDPLLYTRALIYDYRDIFGLMDGTITVSGGDEHEDDDDSSLLGACLIDVNCPQGDPWGVQKRATMRTLSSGTLCSGGLLNNTANDGTQYVLTANHCGQGSNTVFAFKYERPGCGSGSAPTNFTVSGATLLATSGTYDNRLMRITNPIPANYDPYFAGWTRTTVDATYAFAMGHPSGGPKKISIDSNGTNRENVYWRVTWHEGTLEGGSSGGPLFDQDGRVRGPACCVNNFTCSQTAWFGRFDRFYTTSSLAQWLDPLGHNPTFIDGMDPSVPPCTDDVVNYCLTSPNSVGSGAIMSYSGSTSVSANDLTLLAFGLPSNQFAIFYYGPNAIQAAFGNGYRCVGGGSVGVFRLPVVQSDSFGDLSYTLDLTVPPASSGPGHIVDGDDWNFQAWYRDTAGGGANFNLSDGLRVTFCP